MTNDSSVNTNDPIPDPPNSALLTNIPADIVTTTIQRFKAATHPVRLVLLLTLRETHRTHLSQDELRVRLSNPETDLEHQLTTLKQANLIDQIEDSDEQYYTITPAGTRIINYLRGEIQHELPADTITRWQQRDTPNNKHDTETTLQNGSVDSGYGHQDH